MPSANFHQVSERQAYKTALLNFYVGTFEGPGGQVFERDILRHPGAVVIVPYDEATGEVIFVRQYRSALDTELLELPAGKCDVSDEPPATTAGRELVEEVGAKAGRLDQIGRFYTSPGFCDEEMWAFLARDLSPVPPERHGIEEEHMLIERYPLSEVAEMVWSGQLKDAKSIVSLFLAQAVLGH